MSENVIETEWMLMIYLAGDNNLSEDMAGTLDQIATMKPPKLRGAAALAYYDSSYPNVPSRYCDLTPKLMGATSGISREDCEIAKETNSADPETIVEFVRWCRGKYRAKNYALFLSGHTDGFQGMSLFRDEQAKTTMTLKGLRKGLEKIRKELLGDKLQILAFDGCVMSTLEVAYEFRNEAEILIGSQGFIPNAGLNYAELLDKWNAESYMKTPEQLAVKTIDVYLKRQEGFAIGGRSVTISACRLGSPKDSEGTELSSSPVVNLRKRVNELSEILYNNLVLNEIFTLSEDMSDQEALDFLIEKYLKRERLKRIILSSQWNSQSLLFEQSIDIQDFCERIIEEYEKARLGSDFIVKNMPDEERDAAEDALGSDNSLRELKEIAEKCREIIKEVEKCVIATESVKPVGSEYQFAHGLSLFFPWSQLGYGMTKEEYEKTEFCKSKNEKRWNKFIEWYVSDVTMRGFNEKLWNAVKKALERRNDNKFNLLEMRSAVDKILKLLSDRYNPIYNTRGLENDTYLRFFSKFKNLPPLIEDDSPIILLNQ